MWSRLRALQARHMPVRGWPLRLPPALSGVGWSAVKPWGLLGLVKS